MGLVRMVQDQMKGNKIALHLSQHRFIMTELNDFKRGEKREQLGAKKIKGQIQPNHTELQKESRQNLSHQKQSGNKGTASIDGKNPRLLFQAKWRSASANFLPLQRFQNGLSESKEQYDDKPIAPAQTTFLLIPRCLVQQKHRVLGFSACSADPKERVEIAVQPYITLFWGVRRS